MNLAIKELIHSRKKYLLVEIIIILMVFMVLFLSGLASGLGRAVSASIENADAQYFILSENAENLITVSNLNTDILDEVSGMTTDDLAPFDIQRMYLSPANEDLKIDVTYFAIDEESFLSPDIKEGQALSDNKGNAVIVLDESFKSEGIKLNDVLKDTSTGVEMTVVGFTSDEMYGHTGVGFISMDTYSKIREALNPKYEQYYHAVAVSGTDIKNINIDGISVVSKNDIVESIPGYKAEQTTINMILWVLVVISAAILGVFFYVITIQKEKQFGVLKAIGMGMGELASMITGQVIILSCFGSIVANALVFLMSKALPSSMPFYLNGTSACIVSIAFILISILCSLLSTLKVSKVDPMITIGGNE